MGHPAEQRYLAEAGGVTVFNITLSDVKAYLGYAESDTSRDVSLQLLLDAGYSALRSLLQRNLEYGLYTDTFQYRTWKMYLTESPIDQLIAVRQGVNLVDPSEYRVFKTSGMLVFSSWANFRGVPNWVTDSEYVTVEYVGGYVDLPGDIKLALFNAVQAADNIQKQNTQYGGQVKRLSVYDVGVTDLAVPRDGSITTIESSLRSSLSTYLEQLGGLAGWMVHESEFAGPGSGSPL